MTSCAASASCATGGGTGCARRASSASSTRKRCRCSRSACTDGAQEPWRDPNRSRLSRPARAITGRALPDGREGTRARRSRPVRGRRGRRFWRGRRPRQALAGGHVLGGCVFTGRGGGDDRRCRAAGAHPAAHRLTASRGIPRIHGQLPNHPIRLRRRRARHPRCDRGSHRRGPCPKPAAAPSTARCKRRALGCAR